MNESLWQDPIGIPRGSLLRIDGSTGRMLHVWEGELWLTQEGSQKDHVLTAGQSFCIDRDGAMLAQAFRRSLVSLSAPVSRVSGLRKWAAKLLEPLRPADPITL